MNKLLIAIVFMAHSITVFAQVDNGRVTSEFKKLAELYTALGPMSFSVSYYYADEQAPKQYLDSIKGTFKIQGKHFWYKLNETEAMSSDEYIVMLFKEDMIMYLAKPAATIKDINPLSLLDSFFINNKQLQGSVEEIQEGKKITILFTAGHKYKKIEYYINKKTGLISRMLSVVESSEMFDSASSNRSDTSSSYAIVEVVFGDYQKSVDTKNFNAGKYFRKEGANYVPVYPYESYKIFLGSPNL